MALGWPWGGLGVALDGFVPGVGAGSPSCFLRSENSDSSTYCPFAPDKPGCPLEGRGRMASGPETHALATSNLWSVFRRPSPTPARTSRETSRARPTSKTAARPNESDPWCAGCRHPAAQYTNTSTAAFSADFTTSSNLESLVLGSLSLAAASGTDSRKQAALDGVIHVLRQRPARRHGCRHIELGRYHADHVAALVHQRSARVAGLHR